MDKKIESKKSKQYKKLSLNIKSTKKSGIIEAYGRKHPAYVYFIGVSNCTNKYSTIK